MEAGLVAYQLRLTIQAIEPLELEQHPGSALRGLLFQGLWERFCMNRAAIECATCPLVQTCPVSALVAPLRDEHPRGRDIPRPFVIRPPLVAAAQAEGLRLEPGHSARFGLTLFGSAGKLFPYVVMAAQVMEKNGLGRALAANGRRRGRFVLEQIEAVHPFTGEEKRLFTRGQKAVQAPAIAVTAADVAARANALPAEQVTLHFLTPTRLTAQGQRVLRPDLLTLALRLAERLEQVEQEYAEPGERPGQARYEQIRELAAAGSLVSGETRWVEVQSYSSRQRRFTPIGGFVGRATFRVPDAPLLRELLVWGEVIHVGKDAVKGNGWYQLEP
jgi:CRISPR/Cas system endoribonuclease Cas6 (RAMP superfamily)